MTMNDVAINRKQESGHVPARNDRLFIQYDYWYFKTREGMSIGPFDNASEAIEGINGFIDFLNTAEPDIVNRISRYVSRAA